MLQTCRPKGGLFYLALAVAVVATGIRLSAREEVLAGSKSRVAGARVVKGAAEPGPRGATPAPQSGPALTSVIDTVYMADGSTAEGVLVITWPAFVGASGSAVAAGALNVTLGSGGALSVELATNAGANPANVYYTVVYQLQPSEVRTEYWVVPASSPATLAQVRTTPGSGTAAQPVSMQYVNSALAGKANDSAVVHLAGTETVTGSKSFAAPPNVPTPVGTGDVTNKAYVDAAIATVGAGNYLPTAGGAMTGPLTLSASPTAPLQAAAKQYVDLVATGKANLVSGLVPTNELGSGTASGLNCLLGSGAWGPCGSSANATAIQSVPVAAGAPANGQVLTYSSSSGQYSPATPSGGTGGVSVSPAGSQNVVQPAGTEFSTNNLSNIVYVASSDNWLQNPSGTIAAGANTVSLAVCPRGLTVNSLASAQTYVYISGVGTPEAVLITSTTCNQAGGGSGTLTFTAANTHGSGYTIGSASQGVQEAINAASYAGDYISGGFEELGSIVIPPGQYTWQARVTIPSPLMKLDFAGSFVTCNMADSCLFIGNAAHPTYVTDVTIKNFTGQAGCNNCNYPMIEDAGQGVHFIDIHTANPFPIGSGTNGSSFGSLIQVDGDQATIIDGLDPVQGRWSHCTTSFCSVAVKGPGLSGGSGSGIIWLKNSNLNLYCTANGVDNQNANTMRISDSVVEAQAQFGVRATSTYSNVPAVELDNVYFEVGGCAGTNPLGIGQAGLIVENGWASVRDSVGPVGAAPVFANTGSTQYDYYVVAHSSTGSLVSAPFLAGIALTNGSGTIPVVWPQFGTTGTITYDVIRTSGIANEPAPYTAICGGGSTTTCGSVATGLTVSSACSAVGSTNICSFSDTASASTSSYVVTTPPTYYVALPFWNGSVIYTMQTDAVGVSPTPSGVYFDRMGDNVANLGTNPVSQMVSSFGALIPKFFAQSCNGLFGGSWQSCLENAYGPASGATLLSAGAYNAADNAGEKGRLILEEGLTGFINGGHKITIADSNPAKTLASAGMRPTEDANDTYIGLDNASQANASNAQLAFGAPVSISNYIGSNPNNVSFLERLTTSAKTFNVPVSINGNLTVTGTCTGCGGGGAGTVNSGTATQVAMYSANGAAVSGDSELTDSGSTLNYAGSNGISASAGTFSGNVTVNGQLLVAGPWMVSSPIPGTAMAAAGAGTSALGISNDGNFYVSANAGTPQKVATTATSSYFSDLFQEDANDLGQYNGTTAQNLHVYSSYTNSSTWLRTSLGYDATDNYAVVRSESSPSGGAPGLGFWINSGLKWVVDASGNYKPWTDQTYNLGSFNSAGSGSGLRPATVYVAGNSTSGSGFELGRFANQSYELCNDTTNGTVVNGLAVLTSAGCAAKPSSALAGGAIGVVIANAGTSGVVTLARTGSVYCSFDGSTTVVGDYVVPSSTANSGFYPLCHDAGATQPSGTQVLGRVLQASSGSATVQMFLDMPGSNVSTSAAYSIPWFTTNTTGTAISFSSTASKAELWGVVLTFPLTTTQVTYNVSTADNTSNTYDIGVLNSSGNVVAHIGNTAGTAFAASTGWKTLSWAAGATLQPGKYYLAITSSCTSTCAQIFGGSSAGFTFVGGSGGTAESVTAGGTLNNGITIPADNPTEAAILAWEIH
jgi:hypothetical protein